MSNEKQLCFGAAPATWDRYAENGWLSSMLPVVSDPNAEIAPNSTLKSLGKTPTLRNPEGFVVGIPKWTTKEISLKDFTSWRDKDYGICLRCDDIVAIDCDVENQEISDTLYNLMFIMLGDPPLRKRAGSARWLAPFRLDGVMKKHRVVLNGGDAIEVLAKGQQFIAEGTHPKGKRYEWDPHAPKKEDLPLISVDQVKAFLNEVVKLTGGQLAGSSNTGDRPTGTTVALPDPLADWLRSSGRVISRNNGILNIACPWASEHTGDSGHTSTSYFSAGVNGEAQPGFKCLHAHCAHRTYGDFETWACSQGYDPTKNAFETSDEEYPVGRAGERSLVQQRIIRSHTSEKTGKVQANLSTVMAALSIPEIASVKLAYDTFSSTVVYKDAGRFPLCGPKKRADFWTPISDAVCVLLRERLQREFQFESISDNLFRDSLMAITQGGYNEVDTMCEYLRENLPAWDGVKRVDRFLVTYCGAEDNRFARDLSRYIFSALYGRAVSVEGVKADITPIFIGDQGIRKSTFIRYLSPRPGTHVELNFSGKDDDMRRLIRGKCTVEIPELAGLSKKDTTEVKYFLSQRSDSWVVKYSEYTTTAPRRCVFFGTSNEYQILNDPTGSRRFAPIEVTNMNVEKLQEDILQLWAEGKTIFEKEGIDHHKVEEGTKLRAKDFTLTDSWAPIIQYWMDNREEDADLPTTELILDSALGIPPRDQNMASSRRVCNLMRSLGYKCKTFRPQCGAKPQKGWYLP